MPLPCCEACVATGDTRLRRRLVYCRFRQVGGVSRAHTSASCCDARWLCAYLEDCMWVWQFTLPLSARSSELSMMQCAAPQLS